MEFRTIPEMVRARAAKHGTSRKVFREKVNNVWAETDWKGFVDRVEAIARGLVAQGFAPGDFGAIFAYNSPDWLYVDFAHQFAGGTSAPVYMNNTAEEAAFVVRHSGSKFVFVDDQDRLDKLLSQRATLPDLKAIVTRKALQAPADAPVMTLDALVASGAGVDRKEVDKRIAGLDPQQPFTLVYTSGTTGVPKGAMLTHYNFLWVLDASTKIDIPRLDHEFMISYLPLAHVAQRIGDYLGIYNGATISFAESLEKFPENLQEIQPTTFVAVPRILEKLYLKVMGGAQAKGGTTLKIFKWAEGLAREYYQREVYGKKPARALFDAQWRVAQRLVYSKIVGAISPRLRYIAAGGAPLPKQIGEFFYGIGLPIFEVYGLTETSAPITHATMKTARYGTVGKPLAGTQVKIAEDGEVLFKGPNLFPGYYKSEEQTSEAIDAEGWFHTGDLGSLDAEGYLTITGRKKELIVTSGGKNIAPAPIESEVKRLPFISQAVVIGDNRNYLTALLTLNAVDLAEYAKKEGIAFESVKDLAASPQIRKILDEHMKAVNTKLASYQAIKKWTVLPEDFSTEAGELTPTLKLKRPVIAKKYGKVIDGMYEGRGEGAA